MKIPPSPILPEVPEMTSGRAGYLLHQQKDELLKARDYARRLASVGGDLPGPIGPILNLVATAAQALIDARHGQLRGLTESDPWSQRAAADAPSQYQRAAEQLAKAADQIRSITSANRQPKEH